MDMGARLCVGVLALLPGTAAAVAAEPRVPGDRLSGSVLPVEPIASDITLDALRAWTWTVEDTTCLQLEGQVRILVGDYAFGGDAAVVWINRIPSAQGPINQIAAYFDRLEDPSQASGLGMSGRNLLITGSARGGISLNVALLRHHRPPPGELLTTGRRRLASYLAGLTTDPPALAQRPQIGRVPKREVPVPVPGGPITPLQLADPAVTAEGLDTPPIFAPKGTVWFSWRDVMLKTGVDENVIIASGSVVAHYLADVGNQWSPLTLSADRAVVFTDPGEIDQLAGGRLTAESIRGIYLEGNVIATAGDNEYSVRAPRVYYDFRANQAIMLESVLRTYARSRNIAVYARAEEMRQIAANQWTARQARVSTSDFYTPHFSLGARQVTVTQRPAPHDPDGPVGPNGPGAADIHIDSRGNTLQAGNLPFFYWPHYSGTVDTPPLRSVQGGYRTSDGAVIKTTWDPFSLVGADRPAGVEANLKIDGYTKRGLALGLDLSYTLNTMAGALDLYGLHDDGVDRTSSGLDVVPPTDWRGLGLWEHQMSFGPDWTLQGQLSWISDATFVTSWRERDFYDRREYETAVSLKYQSGNSALTFLAKYNLNDFISNSYLLASRAYQVQKLPEVSYRRYGDALFDLMSYSGETRAGLMQFKFESGTPGSLGVPAVAFPFMTPPGGSITAGFLGAGYTDEWVARFDTRHELAMPLHWGAFNMVPYVVGRLTAYDTDFRSYSPDAEQFRVFGSAGLRLNTQFQHVDNSVESALFDLHRMRHVVEPRATLWYGYSNVPDGAYPVYDQSVEPLATGPVAEVGLRSVWQTKRGGPGRWRSVDFLTVDASVVYSTSDLAAVMPGNNVIRESPTARFFDYRPEYSQMGDHVAGSLIWLPSDTLSVVGEVNYDLDGNTLSRGSIGTELRHTPDLTTIVEYRYIDAGGNQLLEIGWEYQLTRKYKVALRPQWDFAANDFRAISLILTRTFPDFDVTFLIRRDEIADQTTVGASLDLVEF